MLMLMLSYLIKVSQLPDGGDIWLDEFPLRVWRAGNILTADVLTHPWVQVWELTSPASQVGEVLLSLGLGLLCLAVANPPVTERQSSQLSSLSRHPSPLSHFSPSWSSLCLSPQSISLVREFHWELRTCLHWQCFLRHNTAVINIIWTTWTAGYVAGSEMFNVWQILGMK